MRAVSLTPHLEDYIEAIGEVCQQSGVARVKEIASRMEVTNPSVVRALQTLKREGLVEQERYGFVRLTEAGHRVAGSVLHRHAVLADLLENVLGIDSTTASEDACRMEHVISEETFGRLCDLVAFAASDVHGGRDFSRGFRRFSARRTRGATA